MVFDVPATEGGALTILKEFYEKYRTDERNQYCFVVSRIDLVETNNIKVCKYPWVKKSWAHRIYFDYFIAPKIVEKFQPDYVLSLQNIIIPRVDIEQHLYLHNAIPFSEIKFSILKDFRLWVYQNVIGLFMKNSARRANKIYVQVKWFKDLLVDKLKLDPEKVKVVPPDINITSSKKFRKTHKSMRTFFYPASGERFKNHSVVIEACLQLKKEGFDDYEVIFTLSSNENNHISRLYKIVQKYSLPIKFVGRLSREAVFDYYSKSVLLFPSLIETIGLPLREAEKFRTPMVILKSEYSSELENICSNILSFNESNSAALVEVLKKIWSY
ncbi:MAG TPA: glycosyltransferase [Ignavibacteria bacterium]|nr:glycosyltransferase [Ignavibacteria bacterium]